jgi:hypothetical protein
VAGSARPLGGPDLNRHVCGQVFEGGQHRTDGEHVDLVLDWLVVFVSVTVTSASAASFWGR